MPGQPFSWEGLDKFKRNGRFIAHYPPNVKAFYSPDDDLHGLLQMVLASAEQSIVLNMFGYDDTDLDTIIKTKLKDEHVYVQMSLDRGQSKSGKTERQILAAWDNDYFGNSIAIGTSSKHAISHLKMVIVDGIYTVKGSTNWSLGGEQKLEADDGGGLHDESGNRVAVLRRAGSGEWIVERQNSAADSSDQAVPTAPPQSKLRQVMTRMHMMKP